MYFVHFFSFSLVVSLIEAVLPIKTEFSLLFLSFPPYEAYLGSMRTALHIGWDPTTSPLPPHLGSYTRNLLVSQGSRHLFVTPWWENTLERIFSLNWAKARGRLGVLSCCIEMEAAMDMPYHLYWQGLLSSDVMSTPTAWGLYTKLLIVTFR